MTAGLTPSERVTIGLPVHLRRYVVPQEYSAYTPRDQAVWRHILRRLVRHLATRAHPSYLRGLEATGIGTERIPSMDEMNEKLARLGGSAGSVRGLIPPGAAREAGGVSEPIGALSVGKGARAPPPGEVAAAERRLAEASASRRFVSE